MTFPRREPPERCGPCQVLAVRHEVPAPCPVCNSSMSAAQSQRYVSIKSGLLNTIVKKFLQLWDLQCEPSAVCALFWGLR